MSASNFVTCRHGCPVKQMCLKCAAQKKRKHKIDAFALAKKLGSKISLNFNEWKMIAKAVEAQLKEPRK